MPTDATATAVQTDTSYTKGATSVTIRTVTTGSGSDTLTYYVAEVTLNEATTLRTPASTCALKRTTRYSAIRP